LVFYDLVTEIDEFEYYCFIRHYEIAFIFYEEELKYKYLNSIKWIQKNNLNISTYFLTDSTFIKDNYFKNELIKKAKAKEIIYSDKLLLQRKEPLNEKLPELIEKKMLSIPSEFEFDFDKRKIYYFNEYKEKIWLPFKKKIDFVVMHCFALHKNQLLTLEQITNFASLIPEDTNNLIIENSITSIRRTFQQLGLLGKMDIISKKKFGYIFSYN
jgi:hypothetical protein